MFTLAFGDASGTITLKSMMIKMMIAPTTEALLRANLRTESSNQPIGLVSNFVSWRLSS